MTDCVVTRDERPHLQRGAHGGHCPGDSCPGCLPVPALPRLAVCGEHVDEVRGALRLFPELWTALAEPRTTGSRGTWGGTGDDAPQALPQVVAARMLIRSTLVTWCKVLDDEHGVPLPDEQVIVARTMQEAYNADADADVALDAGAWALGVADLGKAATLRQDARQLRRRAAGLRDVIDALRDHLDRHLPLLLAGGWTAAESGYREAQVFAEDVLDVAARARRAAYPTMAAVRIECSCGARVAIDPTPAAVDKPARTFRCPGCGLDGTLDQWRTWDAPDTSRPLPLSELPLWLADHHDLTVTHKQLRNWRDRDTIRPLACCVLPGAAGPHRPDCDATGSAQVFDPLAVLLVARARLTRQKAG
jgi:hypothetical protein